MKTKMANGRRQLAAWTGMIGPVLFVAIFTIEGWLRPGYDARGMFVSELALGPRGWIQIVNFLLFGLLFLLFTRGVAAEFQEGKASRAGPILLAIIGISLFASGIFVMDPVTTPPEQMSWHGNLHNLFGALVFLLIPLSCFVFLRRFRVDAKWRSLQWWTLAAGMITAVLLIVWSVGAAEPPAPPTIFNEWTGFMQRAILVTYLSWQFVFAWELGRQKKTGSALILK
ncbi:MAG: DUF998 domain-containing protein [Chloroflexota bacterium]